MLPVTRAVRKNPAGTNPLRGLPTNQPKNYRYCTFPLLVRVTFVLLDDLAFPLSPALLLLTSLRAILVLVAFSGALLLTALLCAIFVRGAGASRLATLLVTSLLVFTLVDCGFEEDALPDLFTVVSERLVTLLLLDLAPEERVTVFLSAPLVSRIPFVFLVAPLLRTTPSFRLPLDSRATTRLSFRYTEVLLGLLL